MSDQVHSDPATGDELSATQKRPRVSPTAREGDTSRLGEAELSPGEPGRAIPPADQSELMPLIGSWSETMPLPVTAVQPRIAGEPDDTGALVEKSIRGTQWIMLAILIGVPLGFLTTVVMYRLSPSALGLYRLMLLLVTTVQTFFLFGGANVIVNFIPRARPKDKLAFIATYLSITLGFAVIFFAVVLLRPDLLRFLLLGNPVDARVYLFLLGFIPLVIAQTLTIAILQGEMELGAAARTQYGVQTAGFAIALVVVYGIVRHHLLPDTIGAALIVPGAYLLSLLTGSLALVRVIRRRWVGQGAGAHQYRLHLPPGFWRFTTTFHIHTIVTFFFNNIDQIFILYYFGGQAGIAQNGEYGAALVIATYALWAPNLFTGAMYPFFTNLVARGDLATLRGAYQRYCAITSVVVATMGLLFGLFAPQIVLIYGVKGGHAAPLALIEIFAFMYVALASAAYVPTAALITAHEAVWINLSMNALALAVRLVLYSTLVGPDGLAGIAIANAISLGVLWYGTLLICVLRYHVGVPIRQHVISLAGAALLLGSYALVPRLGTFLSLAERLAALLLFILIIAQLRLVSRADLERVARRVPGLKRLVAR